MNLILDSHALIWLMEANPNLSSIAASLIADPANRLYLSMASAWEISIKVGLKKMVLSVPFAEFLHTAINGYGLAVLPITTDDCIAYELLPFPIAAHRDPFDRMILNHALRHSFGVIGNDQMFDAYGVTRHW